MGYLRLVVETEGVMYSWCGLLVMKDSFDEATQEKRKMILGIIGAFLVHLVFHVIHLPASLEKVLLKYEPSHLL